MKQATYMWSTDKKNILPHDITITSYVNSETYITLIFLHKKQFTSAPQFAVFYATYDIWRIS